MHRYGRGSSRAGRTLSGVDRVTQTTPSCTVAPSRLGPSRRRPVTRRPTGSIRVSVPAEPSRTKSAPAPARSVKLESGSARPKRIGAPTTCSAFGSTWTTVPSAVATHTEPKPIVSERGPCPSGIVAAMRADFGGTDCAAGVESSDSVNCRWARRAPVTATATPTAASATSRSLRRRPERSASAMACISNDRRRRLAARIVRECALERRPQRFRRPRDVSALVARDHAGDELRHGPRRCAVGNPLGRPTRGRRESHICGLPSMVLGHEDVATRDGGRESGSFQSLQRSRDLVRERDGALRRQRVAVPQHLVERRSRRLSTDGECVLLADAHLVDGNQTRMLDPRERRRRGEELLGLVGTGGFRRDEQGDASAQALLLGTVDRHPRQRPQDSVDAIAADPGARCERRSRSHRVILVPCARRCNPRGREDAGACDLRRFRSTASDRRSREKTDAWCQARAELRPLLRSRDRAS